MAAKYPTFAAVYREYPLHTAEIEQCRIRDMPAPIDWARKNFRLTTAYARPGAFIPYRWQIEIINAIAKYNSVIICAPTQTGKSLMAEIMVAWVIDCLPMNGIVIYSKKEVASDMFADRIRPMIQEVPAMKKYWSGNADDLTQKKMRLAHMFLRIGSSEVPSDIATWSSGLIYASEVSKYRKRRGWDPIESLKRRQEAYRIIGRHKSIMESSPLWVGDCLYEEMKRSGVLALKAYHKCPHCKKYQILTIKQVKEIPNAKKEYDHDPSRILTMSAARYECVYCRETIEENHRIEMAESMVWAAEGERIENGKVADRKQTDNISFQYTRFVDISYTFAEALSRWFGAQKKGTEAMQTFINEDMGEFWQDNTIQISEDYLQTKKREYRQYVDKEIPNDVLVLLISADCQDDGFYWIVNGYGRGMNKYLVRSGFVEAKKNESVDGKDPHQVAYERFAAAVFAQKYRRKDGRELEIYFGFIDRGGHRPDDVDYICQRIPQIKAYIGATRIDFKKPIIELSANGHWYMGQSMMLSREVTALIASDKFFLPSDVTPDYIEQVRNEYIEPKTDIYGNTKLVYVKIEPNHFRSCENMCLGAVKMNNIEEILFDATSIQTLVRKPETLTSEDESAPEAQSDYLASRRGRRHW